jgi:hypothetical protein
MIVTRADARRIIAREYGPEFKFRLTSGSAQIGCRPVGDPRPSLAWRALAPGADSAAVIGLLLPGGAIDWQHEVTP